MAKIEQARIAMLDTSVLLAWIKGEPECDRVADLLDFIDRGQARLVESTIILAEVYKRPTDKDKWGPKMDMVLAKLRSREVTLLDVTRPVVERAAEYRMVHKLKTPDAVHLATAVLNRCDWLVTLDQDFPAEVEGVRVFNLRRTTPSTPLPWVVPLQDDLFGAANKVVTLRPNKS